jgi:hypothetical protein
LASGIRPKIAIEEKKPNGVTVAIDGLAAKTHSLRLAATTGATEPEAGPNRSHARNIQDSVFLDH